MSQPPGPDQVTAVRRPPGLGIYQKESLEEVRRLIEQDPGVAQGLYCFDVMTWRTAPGTVTPPPAAWARG